MPHTMALLNIASIIDGNAAFTPSAGDKVFEQIHESLQRAEETTLDFKGINLITTAFLNAALGQLYAYYDSGFLNQHLKLRNVAPDDSIRFKLVLDNAKDYFKNREQFGNDRSNTLFES